MKKERIFWMSLLIGVTVSFSSLYFANRLSSDNDDANAYRYARIFEKTYNIIRDYYVDSNKAKTKKLYFGAIEGLLKSLGDEHTSFLSPKIWKELHESLSGEFEGLGIVIGLRDNYLTVISPIEGSPAFKKGIMAGDVIYKIEGKSTKGITLDEAVTKLRGRKGTPVTVTIVRKTEPKPFKVTITRDVIHVDSVKYTMINSEIGYARIIQFQKNVDVDLRNAIKKLYKRGMKKLILDVRNNPGGYLSKAVNVVDLFLSKGKIVSSKGRVSSSNEEYYAHSFNTISRDTPLIVLVNGASASASEILAGAIQDTRRGVILGEKSYGKASVQNVVQLSSGDEAFGLKITTALYYTPANRLIHKKGIKPDIVVKLPEIEMKEILARRIILDKKLIEKFLRRFRVPSELQIRAFHKSLAKRNLPVTLRLLRKMIYDIRHKNAIPPIFDLSWDIQLTEAIKTFRTKPGLFKREQKAFE
jgi:carboxyl-terminal processing protease